MGHHIVRLEMKFSGLLFFSTILIHSHSRSYLAQFRLVVEKFHFRRQCVFLLVLLFFCWLSIRVVQWFSNIFSLPLSLSSVHWQRKTFDVAQRKLRRFTHPAHHCAAWDNILNNNSNIKRKTNVSICRKCVEEYHITAKLDAISNKYSYSCVWDFGIEHQLSKIIWGPLYRKHAVSATHLSGRAMMMSCSVGMNIVCITKKRNWKGEREMLTTKKKRINAFSRRLATYPFYWMWIAYVTTKLYD